MSWVCGIVRCCWSPGGSGTRVVGPGVCRPASGRSDCPVHQRHHCGVSHLSVSFRPSGLIVRDQGTCPTTTIRRYPAGRGPSVAWCRKSHTPRGDGGQTTNVSPSRRPGRRSPMIAWAAIAHERHPHAKGLLPPAHPTQLSATTQHTCEVEPGHERSTAPPRVFACARTRFRSSVPRTTAWDDQDRGCSSLQFPRPRTDLVKRSSTLGVVSERAAPSPKPVGSPPGGTPPAPPAPGVAGSVSSPGVDWEFPGACRGPRTRRDRECGVGGVDAAGGCPPRCAHRGVGLPVDAWSNTSGRPVDRR